VRGVPVLLVDVYDDAGPKDSGLWAYSRGYVAALSELLRFKALSKEGSRPKQRKSAAWGGRRFRL
jgi:hypothetical protein